MAVFALLLTAGGVPRAGAYSVLTHEQLIDLAWQGSIAPLLRSRYPNLTAAELERARAYAYGGCVIQDIGYYPFGDPFFSNLTHYVRSGDFVVNLFRNAHNANEMAFAIGALSHYIGDNVGHSLATNRAVPVEFPRLRRRYGSVVSYAEGKHEHVQTEFAFDVHEIRQGRLAPLQYLRHVGLEVPTEQLGRAFYETYGLGEDFGEHRSRRVNVRGYRFAVRSFVPRIAYALNVLHGRNRLTDLPSPELDRLSEEVRVVATANDWDSFRRKPGIGTYSLAALIYILPKFGPLKLVAIKGPTAQTEDEYVRSVQASVGALEGALARFGSPRQSLENRDLDTGLPVRPGGYILTDETYADLLRRVTEDARRTVLPPGLKRDLLGYYADPAAPISTKKDAGTWARVQAQLEVLRGMSVSDKPVAAESQ